MNKPTQTSHPIAANAKFAKNNKCTTKCAYALHFCHSNVLVSVSLWEDEQYLFSMVEKCNSISKDFIGLIKWMQLRLTLAKILFIACWYHLWCRCYCAICGIHLQGDITILLIRLILLNLNTHPNDKPTQTQRKVVIVVSIHALHSYRRLLLFAHISIIAFV